MPALFYGGTQRETWVIVAWYMCVIVSDFVKPHVFEKSNRVYNKFTNIRQHNNYLLDRIGYKSRPVNRSSSGLQQNKSKVLIPVF